MPISPICLTVMNLQGFTTGLHKPVGMWPISLFIGLSEIIFDNFDPDQEYILKNKHKTLLKMTLK